MRRGTVYGLLGPNGAGKTTTIRILATLIRQGAGTACVLGRDVRTEADAVRQKVSLTGQLASVDEDLTGRENLILVGRLLGLGWREAGRRAAGLLGAFDLDRPPRARRAHAVSASLTLGWRALLKIKHVPFQLFDVKIGVDSLHRRVREHAQGQFSILGLSIVPEPSWTL